jgi:hypothetical protein
LTDPVVPACHRDVAGHFLGVLDDRQAATDLSWQLDDSVMRGSTSSFAPAAAR